MQKRRDRTPLTNRRSFASMALAALFVSRSAPGAESTGKPGASAAAGAAAGAAVTPAAAQRSARLPRRLAADFRRHTESRLPHLRPVFENAAKETGFNWRLLAALAYQESRWLPAAVSPKGAQGVMMLMPLTAKKMGVTNVFSAEENILAGSRYLAYLKTRIPKRIRDPDRTLLAMAAYNVGIGHLEDARIITQMRKKNPDRWSDVRANLPRLSDPRWHKRVKRGYARGEETAQFVERVSQFAALLEHHLPEAVLTKADRP